MADQHTNGNHDDASDVVDSSRRSLFTKGAAVAAVAAVAGMSSQKAHAANGDTMLVGTTNTGSNTTTIQGGSTLRVTNGDSAGDASIYGTQSSTGGDYGVHGLHTGSQGVGVYGNATGSGGYGVYGTANSSDGVGVYGYHLGTTQGGTGVIGRSNDGNGVIGRSSSGTGVVGRGTDYDLRADGVGRLGFTEAGNSGVSDSGAVGTIARDTAGNLWYCYAANQWQRVGGPSAAGVLHAIEPTRVYDSRRAATPNSGSFGSNSSRVISIKDARDLQTGEVTVANIVPAGAKAITFNVTATLTTAASFLAVGSGDATEYTASSLNWFSGGATVGNATLVKINANREVTIFAGPFGQFDAIIDVTGYFI